MHGNISSIQRSRTNKLKNWRNFQAPEINPPRMKYISQIYKRTGSSRRSKKLLTWLILIDKDFRSSWRRAADSCAARRGCAEAEAQQRRPSSESIGGEGVHRRAPSWRGPQARRMASFRSRSAPAPRPRPRRRTRANHRPAIAIVWLCSVARELEKRPL